MLLLPGHGKKAVCPPGVVLHEENDFLPGRSHGHRLPIPAPHQFGAHNSQANPSATQAAARHPTSTSGSTSCHAAPSAGHVADVGSIPSHRTPITAFQTDNKEVVKRATSINLSHINNTWGEGQTPGLRPAPKLLLLPVFGGGLASPLDLWPTRAEPP